MCKHGTTVERVLPDFVQREERRVSQSVKIDACMVDLVDELWAAGVVTRSVCCGHGTEWASVVVHEHAAAEAHELCGGRARVMYWHVDELRTYVEVGGR